MGNLRVVVIIEHPTDKRLHVSQRAIGKKRYPGLFNLGVESAIVLPHDICHPLSK